MLNRSRVVVNSAGTNLNTTLSLCDRALFTGEDGDIWLVLLVLSSYSHMEGHTLRDNIILTATVAATTGCENSTDFHFNAGSVSFDMFVIYCFKWDFCSSQMTATNGVRWCHRV